MAGEELPKWQQRRLKQHNGPAAAQAAPVQRPAWGISGKASSGAADPRKSSTGRPSISSTAKGIVARAPVPARARTPASSADKENQPVQETAGQRRRAPLKATPTVATRRTSQPRLPAAPSAARQSGAAPRAARSACGAPGAPGMASDGPGSRNTGTGTPSVPPSPRQGSAMEKLRNEFASLQQQLVLLNGHKRPDASTGMPSPAPKHTTPTPVLHPPAALPPSVLQPLASNALPPVVPQRSQQRHTASLVRAGGTCAATGADAGKAPAPLPAAPASLAPCSGAFPAAAAADITQEALQLHTGGGSESGAAALQALCAAGGPPGSKLGAAAAELFGEPDFASLVAEGMAAQLQRSSEGATTQSRILELAGMVKHLRRCLRELMGRSGRFAERAAQLERLASQQLEDAHLAADTALKRLEAEAALARKAAAQTESTYRSERAAWVTDLDMQRFEVARLKRDVESLEEARSRAREDAQRCEQSRMALEAELKEYRKTTHQALREQEASAGEVGRMLAEERAAAESSRARLEEEKQGLQVRLGKAEARASALDQQLAAELAKGDTLRAALSGKSTSEAVMGAQLAEARACAEDANARAAEAGAERARLQQELSAARHEATLAAHEATLAAQRLEAAAGEAAEAAAAAREEAGVLRQRLEETQGRLNAATGRVAELESGQSAAEAELCALRPLQAQHQQLQSRHQNLQLQAEALQASLQEGTSEAAALRADLETARGELATAREEAGTRGARLAHLESQFEALQEVMGGTEERKDVVARLLAKISALVEAAAAAEATRRALHNELMEVRGNIRVFCRVRPHPASTVRASPATHSLSLALDGREHAFAFDRVFAPGSQSEVFGAVSELVQSALDGYHVCLFSYGQTGAGKTFTMQGGASEQQRGIIPRAVEQILARVEVLSGQEWSYSLEASFIEVYNNALRDLLAEGGPAALDQNAIKHDPSHGHTHVAGARRLPVTTAAGAADVLARASAARAVEATAMNATSSRSHGVFMLHIRGDHPASGTRLTGSLCLVDLAGSERLDRSLAEDQRKREACSINQSLSALGDVFAALAAKSGHVPYRNSKLTYLLQPCLGGSGKTLMLVNINPEPESAFESLCSLKFAAKVNGVDTAARGGARRNCASLAPPSAPDCAGERRMSLASAGASGTAVPPGGKRPAAAADKAAKRSRMG